MSRSQASGVFANLIPKIEALSELDPNREQRTEPAAPEPPINAVSETEMPFFELDEIDLEIPAPVDKPHERLEPDSLEPSESETRPLGRKISPFEIPAGHVELDRSNRFPSPNADFNLDHPERFVGRTVKRRYEITEFLGGDESGLSYLGEDKIVEDRKVLVRILIEVDLDVIMSSVLAEERVSLSHFSHPNVARLIDSGEFSDGTSFLISEYIDALSVDDILTIHGKFDPTRTGRLIRQAANALSEAHQEGIIHRDIRPENLIIDPTVEPEQIRVVNFGASDGEPNAINLLYRAPEVLEGRIASASSDIFSLGVVAFEMLTGQYPFRGETEKELFRAQTSGNIPSAGRLNEDLPRSIDEVFEKAFAIDPADRFPKARDLGDALQASLAQPPRLVVTDDPFVPPILAPPEPVPVAPSSKRTSTIVTLEPAAAAVPPAPAVPATPEAPFKEEVDWRNRSPEPPPTAPPSKMLFPLLGLAGLAAIAFLIWFFSTADQRATETANVPLGNAPANQRAANIPSDMPPQPRTIAQPPNTNFYQSTKQDLKGDLLRNFVGFTLFYPKDWTVNGPQNGSSPGARGKFLDISRTTPDGRPKEQMLISYYPSKGTFENDDERFPSLVKETNDTLKKILPGYQMISEGETLVNQNWRAYEIKFQGSGTSATGEKLVVWGRRLFIPAARPGARNGFEITMLATSLADNIRSVDDVGSKGELAAILETFEPTQNF